MCVLLLSKIVFTVLFLICFFGFGFILKVSQPGADWLGAADFRDDFLLVSVFHSPHLDLCVCVVCVYVCKSILSWRMSRDGLKAFILLIFLGLFGSCMPGFSPCEYLLENIFLLYSPCLDLSVCVWVCVCVLGVWFGKDGRNRTVLNAPPPPSLHHCHQIKPFETFFLFHQKERINRADRSRDPIGSGPIKLVHCQEN